MRKFGIAFLLFLALLSLSAAAGGDELGESFGVPQAQAQMPKQAQKYIDTEKDIGEQINFKAVLNFISNGTFDIVRGAISDFGKIMAVVILFMALSAFCDDGIHSYTKTAFNFAVMLCLALVVYDCCGDAINEAFRAVFELSTYLKALLPVFAATMAGSGAVTSAVVLPSVLLTALDIVSGLNANFFLPIMQIFFAVCLAGAASDKVAVAGLSNFLKTTVIYALTGVTTIFVGVMGIQRVVASGADTVAAKAAKFAVGSVVPVVGGIVRDAFDTVAGGIGMIKSVSGAIGIAAIFYTLAPVFIRLILYSLMFKAAMALAALGGRGKVSGFLGSVSELWNVIFAVTVFEAAILVIGIAIILSVGGAAV